MKNLVVDFEAKAITITRNFSKRAGVVGTPEYYMLMQVKEEFPDYELCVKPNCSPYNPTLDSKLTYADIEEYIDYHFDEIQRDEKLANLQYISETMGFAMVKAWFIKEIIAPDDFESMLMVA